MTPIQRIERARAAQDLLNSELLAEVTQEANDDVIYAWESTKAPQGAEREALWGEKRGISRIAARLRSIVSDGAMAEAELKQPQ